MTAYYMLHYILFHFTWLAVITCDLSHTPSQSLSRSTADENLWDVLVNYFGQLDLQDIVVNYVAVPMNDIDDIKNKLTIFYEMYFVNYLVWDIADQ